LLSEHVEHIIKRITRSRLRSYSDAQDEGDVRHNAIVDVIARLRALRNFPEAESIDNFGGYVTRIADNCCKEWLRSKYPERWGLKNRLRYLLGHRSKFDIWQNDRQEWICGLTEWQRTPQRTCLENKLRDTREFAWPSRSNESRQGRKMEKLVSAFLTWRGNAIPLEDLLEVVAHELGISLSRITASRIEEDEAVNIVNLLPDPRPGAASILEVRAGLEKLWTEIESLPPRQRVALLLNLRDAQGDDALILFSSIGVASMRKIAESVQMPIEEFATLWNGLPLDDSRIAGLLGATRQQVINLRKSARERLTRRMAGY
jgi:hypothetical protein